MESIFYQNRHIKTNHFAEFPGNIFLAPQCALPSFILMIIQNGVCCPFEFFHHIEYYDAGDPKITQENKKTIIPKYRQYQCMVFHQNVQKDIGFYFNKYFYGQVNYICHQ